MARANAAHAAAQAGAMRGLADRQGLASKTTQLAILRLARIELWVRRGVPVMVALFIITLAAITAAMTRDAHDHAVADAFSDLELFGAVVADDIRAALKGPTEAAVETLLAQKVPARALARGQQILVSNLAGEVIAAYPPARGFSGSLTDYLGAAQPLTTFAEKAGVLRINLADGSDALATVRTLAAPYGQIAVIHPMSAILSEWRANAFRIAVLLFCTVLVLIAIAVAYFWQASRAREADRLCERVRERIDTALSRGRCGLWDWDLARGRIYWSHSMYEILGMTPIGQFLSFGDINALVHPQDGDLATIAELLTASQADSVDHAFRMQNVRGEWVWLRARAEVVRDRPGEMPHLVGIAVDITEQKALAERTAAADMRLRDAIETMPEASCFGTPTTAWCCAIRISSNCTICRTKRCAPGTPYAQVMAQGTPADHSRPRSLGETAAAPARAPSRRSSTTAAGCTSANAAPRTAAMSRSAPTSPAIKRTKNN